MGTCGNQKTNNLERHMLRSVYVGNRYKLYGRWCTVLGYDETKNSVFCTREGASNKWYRLARDQRWGGVPPEPLTLPVMVPAVRQTPIEYLQDLYQIVCTKEVGFDLPGIPLKAGATQKQHYWKAQNRWMNYLEYVDFLEERAQEEWGLIPLCIQEMSPCYGNSPSPSPESDDESW